MGKASSIKPAKAARIWVTGIFAALTIAALGGCDRGTPMTASVSPDQPPGPEQPAFAQFSDIPIPGGARMDVEKSLVLGDREAWIGRLVMTASFTPGAMYDFYFREMPRFNWTQITSVRAETSILTYTRQNRVATIQIKGSGISGAAISVTISPRGKPPPPDATDAPPAPGGPVSVTPLR